MTNESTKPKLISDIIPDRKEFVAGLLEMWRSASENDLDKEFRKEVAETLKMIRDKMNEGVYQGIELRGIRVNTPRDQTDIIAAILESKGYKVKMWQATSGDDEIWIEWAQHRVVDGETGKQI